MSDHQPNLPPLDPISTRAYTAPNWDDTPADSSASSVPNWDDWEDERPLPPLPGDKLGDYHYPDSSLPTPPESQAKSRLIPRTVDRIESSITDIAERRPGWKRKLGVVAVGTLVHLGMLGAGVGAVVEATASPHDQSSSADQGREKVSKDSKSTSVSEERIQYQNSEVRSQNVPFSATFMTKSERTELQDSRKALVDIGLEDVQAETPAYFAGDAQAVENFKTIEAKKQELEAQNSKLEAKYLNAEQAESFEEGVKAELDRVQAEFKTAVQLSSGIKMNIYTSKLDSRTEPLSINVKALDVFVNELIDHAGNIPGSPINADIAEMKKQAKEGKLNLRLSTVVVSDESLCIPGTIQASGAFTAENMPRVESRMMNRCAAVGLNLRPGHKGEKDLNQYIMALDAGQAGAQAQYSKSAQELGTIVTPDERLALTLGHEVEHALFGISSQNGTVDTNAEHRLFVYPAESRMYEYFCKLGGKSKNHNYNTGNATDAKFVTPIHVDGPVQK